MEITYTKFPLLLYASYDMKTAPDELMLGAESQDALDFLHRCEALRELFGYIGAAKNTEKQSTHQNYLLSDGLFHTVDSNTSFRNREFSSFFNTYTKPHSGTILFDEGGQYIYLLLGKHETKELKKATGRYIAAGIFKENTFIGFEEGIISERGIEVYHTAYYPDGMDVGGYISFVLIFLSYLTKQSQVPEVDALINKTSEKIFYLK